MKKMILIIALVFAFCTRVVAQDSSYKGFLEGGYLAGVGSYKVDMVDILTTHGLTFGNKLFMGVGIGATVLLSENTIDWWEKYDKHESQRPSTTSVMIPIYADIRYIFGNGGIQPYLDFKLGASFLVSDRVLAVGDYYLDSDMTSVYFSPTFGFHIPIGGKGAGINVGITYNLISQRTYYNNYYDYGINYDGAILNAIGARVQLEW